MKSNPEVRLRGMMGFATRAGKVIFGTEQICAELRKRAEKVKLVLVAHTASDGTKKKIRTKCEFYGVTQREIPLSGEELSDLLGKSFAPSAVAICDEGFAREIAAALDGAGDN